MFEVYAPRSRKEAKEKEGPEIKDLQTINCSE